MQVLALENPRDVTKISRNHSLAPDHSSEAKSLPIIYT